MKTLTNLAPEGATIERLASTIIARTLLDERAKTLNPKMAAILRASDEAEGLARLERLIWNRLCKQYAAFLLAPVVKGETRSVVITARVCHVLTSLSTAIVEAARKEFRRDA